MPLGSKHDETGWLQEAGGQLQLRRDAGGTWRLDAPAAARRLVGARVRVTGTRGEFDLLDVSRIEALRG